MYKKQIAFVLIIGLIITISGVSFAYFIANITGNDDLDKRVIVNTAELGLIYETGNIISVDKALPGWSYTKIFTVTSKSTVPINYDINIIDVINNFEDKTELVYVLKDGNDNIIISETAMPIENGSILSEVTIDPKEVQTYKFEVSFKNLNQNQSYNEGKEFAGKIVVNESSLQVSFPEGKRLVEVNNRSLEITKTITITNTGTETMFYDVLLTDVESTITNKSNLVYTVDGGGEKTAPINNEILLRNESLSGGQSVTHKINIKYKSTDLTETEDYKANLKVDVSKPISIADTIFVNNNKYTEKPNFKVGATDADSGIYEAEDDFGTSYYFRGNGSVLHNNLIFANFQWKIIRINGDGSIRLLFNGLCPKNSCEIDETSYRGRLLNSVRYAFNKAYQYPANPSQNNVGYMYGSTSISSTYAQAHTNTTNSLVKTEIDTWYANNIANKGSDITGLIVDAMFCNDRKVISGTGGGVNKTTYAGYSRINGNVGNPSLKCSQKNDQFTVNVYGEYGNGALKYPVAMITADEMIMAGNLYASQSTPNNYLISGFYDGFWSMTPVGTVDAMQGYTVNLYGLYIKGAVTSVSIANTLMLGIRPVINISPKSIITSGTGSLTDPFIVN